MSEYIDIPQSQAGHSLQHPPSSYGRRLDPYAPSTSIPRVTRVSYGTTGAGTTANRPSWGTNANPTSRPPSSPAHSPGYAASSQAGPEPAGSFPERPQRSRSSRPYGQPSPHTSSPPDILSLPNSPPPRPWTSGPSPDIGRPTGSWVSSNFATHPDSILAPDSPYPLHPPPTNRFGEKNMRMGSVEQRRPELHRSEVQQEPQGYFDEGHRTSPPLSGHDGSQSVSEEAENMTVGLEDMDESAGREDMSVGPPAPTPYRMVGNVYTPPEPVKRPSVGKRFVGGFVSSLKRFPKAMTKNNHQETQPVMPFPPSASMPPVMVPLSPPRYENPPHEVFPPSNPLHERIQIRESGFTADTTTSTQSSAANRGPATPPNLPNPYEPPADLQTPASIASPIEIHPQPTSDYDAMSSPTPEPEETSFSTHVNRVGKFVKEVTHLPWISNRVADEYLPSQSARAQYDKPSGSWYTKRGHQQLDLLAGPTPVKRQVQQRSRAAPPAPKPSHPRPRTRPRANTVSDVVTAIRPSRTPASATSAGRIPVSPGASSHGQGNHSYAYSYYYSTPQPLYVYPSAVSPRMRRSDGSGSPRPEATQAVPVYMLATPAPLVLPASPNHRPHRSTHHHAVPRTTSPPTHRSPGKAPDFPSPSRF